MGRIKVTNTGIIIENYTMGENPDFEKAYLVWDPVTHKNNPFGMLYVEEEKRLYIHGGNRLKTVLYKLQEMYYDRITHHPYKELPDIKMKFGPRDEDQFEALSFMCSQNKYDNLQDTTMRSCNLTTGAGKSYISIASIAFYRIKSIIITSSSTLLKQWKDQILYFTNIPESKIQKINGSDVCNMIINGSSKKFEEAYIILCTHGTLTSFLARYGHEKLYELFEKLGIGLKFFDEAHDHFDSMFSIDIFTNVYKTFYLTATPARSNFRENRIYQISLRDVPFIDLWKEDDKHVHYVAIKYNSRPTAKDLSEIRSIQYGINRMKYIDYVTKKPEFYDMLNIIMKHLVIPCICNKTHTKSNKVLMFIGTNEGILRVYDWIGHNYPEMIGLVGIFTSLVPSETKRHERDDKNLILTTTASSGKGEDIKNLKLTIVLAEPFKSEVVARQTLGRNREEGTMYVEVVDLGTKYTRNFYYHKLPVFNKYALDVSDDHYDNYRLTGESEAITEERKYKLALSPIKFKDDRFDWDAVLPKKRTNIVEENQPKQVVEFFKMPKKNPYGSNSQSEL